MAVPGASDLLLHFTEEQPKGLNLGSAGVDYLQQPFGFSAPA